MSSGGMDLSIGAITSFGGVICAFALKAGMPLPVAVILALAAGSLVGFLNGVIIVKYALPAFIATLGMQYVVNGIIAITTEALAISGFSDSFKALSQTKVGGVVPMPVIYAILIGIVGHIVLSRTKFGRSVLAIGGNRETAYLAGINVRAKQIMVYTAVGFFSALSGILIASRFATAQPAAGTGTELTIMASVIIGGTSMFGGQGTIIGSALGCILFAAIQNALIVMGISTFWQNLIFGIILLVAIFIDKYRRKKGGEE
jgi:ribose transport system permease protein